MKLVRLESGFFTEPGNGDLSGVSRLEKRVVLVYPGKFQSMDGEVEVTDEHLEKLAAGYQARMKAYGGSRLKTGELPAKAFPPMQVDHSTSGWDTVGRLVGVEAGETDIEGKKMKCLFGDIRVLGKENVERVEDGRWTNFSIGADLDEGKWNELTITPFPAAEHAALLARSRLGLDLIQTFRHKSEKVQVYKDAYGKFQVRVNGSAVGDDFKTETAAVSEAKDFIDTMHDTDEKLGRLAKEQWLSWEEAKKVSPNEGIAYIVHETANALQTKAPQKAFADACENQNYHGDRADIVRGREQAAAALKKLGITIPDPKGATLSKGNGAKMASPTTVSYKKYKIEVFEYTPGNWWFGVYGSGSSPLGENSDFKSKEEALAYAKKWIDSDFDEEMSGKRAGSKLSEGDGMDREKLKKKLMDQEKCSAEDAEKKLSEMDDEALSKLAGEDTDEGTEGADKKKKMSKKKLEDKKKEDAEKLAADEEKEEKEKLAKEKEDAEELSDGDEDDEEEKKEAKKKMAAAKSSFINLAKGVTKSLSAARLEARKANLSARLSGLRAKAKITPAEIKKIDVDKMSAKTDAEIDSFFGAFELREDVIPLGQLGSAKAENVARMASELKKKQLEEETATNMSFTGKALKKTRLANGEVAEAASPKVVQLAASESVDVDNLFADICKMMDEGKREDALKALRSHFSSGASEVADAALATDEGEKRMSALAENVKSLQNQFVELCKLVGPILGVDSSELT